MSNSPSHPIPRSPAISPSTYLGRFYGRIRDQILHFTAVSELDQLTDRQLRDIGIDRPQIEQVAAREIARLHAK